MVPFSMTNGMKFGAQKPVDVNRVILWTLVLSQYQRVTDGQTDGRTDGHTDGRTDMLLIAKYISATKKTKK